MEIAIGNDHAGYELKKVLKEWLGEAGHHVKDYGADSPGSVDYPDFVHPLAASVEQGEFQMGVLICGSGQGASMTANKYPGIRAALCWMPEIAALARSHNDANLLCLPGRFLDGNTAVEILRVFLDTPFEGGRHQRRIDKIPIQ
jgi:ribose 5-phosphate isomerase B